MHNAPGLIRGLATIDAMECRRDSRNFRPVNSRTTARAHWMHPIFYLCFANVEWADEAGRMAEKASRKPARRPDNFGRFE
jgi:hypothetical protein